MGILEKARTLCHEAHVIWEAAPCLSSKITPVKMPSYNRVYTVRPDLPKWIMIGLILWFAAEFCAFALVVSFAGLAGALLLGLATSLIGISLLRRLGRDAASSLRQVFGTSDLVFKPETLVDGGFAAMGAVLLILPGFLSDLIGLALCAPSIRFWLADRMKGTPLARPHASQPRDQVIDLGAQDWRRIDDPEPGLGGQR